jgi:pyrimidine operon attenuation protein / uracil phosphoribosyltransferase
MPEEILNSKKVKQKITRIALEIIERNHAEKRVVLAGIEATGFVLALQIVKILESMDERKYECVPVKINKPSPLEIPIQTDVPDDSYRNAVIILVDDVQNSGRTMAFALRHFLQYPVKSIQTCILVDRKHNSFPIKADYVGLSLSTTLKEHVNVSVTNGNFSVTLS